MADVTVSSAVDTFMQAANEAAMRSACGLGTAAVTNTGTGATNTILGNDSRLTDARTPASHAASHLTGSDQISAATTSAKGLMSAADKTKLDGVEASANNYTLPIAALAAIGGVMRNTGAGGEFVSGVDAAGALVYSTPAGGGDVTGAASSVDSRLVAFDGISGKLLKDSGVLATSFIATTREVATSGSLTGGGDLSVNRTLSLSGDSAAPGNSLYYGTDGAGAKGFHALPAGSTPKNSIETDASELQLVGDELAPGNSKYYGTSSAGTKGFHDIPTQYPGTLTESTTARNLALTDAGKYIRLTNVSACTITVFQQSSIAWLADTEIYFRVASTGIPVVAEGSGVTINNKAAAANVVQHGTFALKRVAENVWDFI